MASDAPAPPDRDVEVGPQHPSSATPPAVTLEAFLLSLHDVNPDELQKGKNTCSFVLEHLDFDKNYLTHPVEWADLCAALGRTCMCKSGVASLVETYEVGILRFAPLCHLGTFDIMDLTGSSMMESVSGDFKELHVFIQKHNLVQHYPWLKFVQDEIQALHLDLTGLWDTDLMA